MSEPRPTSVYLYYDGNHVLLYVGITSRNIARQAEHNLSKEWWPFVRSQEVEHFDDRAQAVRRERELIRQYRPPFNVQHNPDHAAVRSFFLAYHQVASLDEDPTDLVRNANGRIPVSPCSENGDLIVFRTSPVFAAAAQRLVKPDVKVSLLYGGWIGGRVRAVADSGPSALIECFRTKPFEAGEAPFIRVKIMNHRDGTGVRFHIKSLQACSEDEARDQRKERQSA